MASSPYKNVVKGGKFYHVYEDPAGKRKFVYIRKAKGHGGSGGTGGTQAPTQQPDPQDAQTKALLSAIGLDDADPSIIDAAKAITDAKIKPQIDAVNQEIGKATGANKYISDRMAQYAKMYSGLVNSQAIANAPGATAQPQLAASSGNAALDAALKNSISARTQGSAQNSATIASVAGMRAQDQQSQLAQQFQSQMNDLQAKRLGIEQGAQGEFLSNLQGVAKQKQDAEAAKFEQQAAAQALGLKIDSQEETARHNKAGEQNTAAGIKQRAQTAENKLTSQERREQAKLEQDAREGRLNREQKERLAHLKAKGKGSGGIDYLPQGQQNTVASKISSIKNLARKAQHEKHWNRRQAAKAILNDNPDLDELYVSVALDLAYDGHVSRANAKKLHDRGVKVKGVGKSYSQYSREARNSGAARTGGN